jgi:hypothetical protein
MALTPDVKRDDRWVAKRFSRMRIKPAAGAQVARKFLLSGFDDIRSLSDFPPPSICRRGAHGILRVRNYKRVTFRATIGASDASVRSRSSFERDRKVRAAFDKPGRGRRSRKSMWARSANTNMFKRRKKISLEAAQTPAPTACFSRVLRPRMKCESDQGGSPHGRALSQIPHLASLALRFPIDEQGTKSWPECFRPCLSRRYVAC